LNAYSGQLGHPEGGSNSRTQNADENQQPSALAIKEASPPATSKHASSYAAISSGLAIWK
jgi:hypothetical protein